MESGRSCASLMSHEFGVEEGASAERQRELFRADEAFEEISWAASEAASLVSRSPGSNAWRRDYEFHLRPA